MDEHKESGRRVTGRLLRRITKQRDAAASQLSASILQLESVCRIAEFTTSASVLVNGGDDENGPWIRWALWANREGETEWRIVFSTLEDQVPLANTSIVNRVRASEALDDLLDAMLAAKE